MFLGLFASKQMVNLNQIPCFQKHIKLSCFVYLVRIVRRRLLKKDVAGKKMNFFTYAKGM